MDDKLEVTRRDRVAVAFGGAHRCCGLLESWYWILDSGCSVVGRQLWQDVVLLSKIVGGMEKEEELNEDINKVNPFISRSPADYVGTALSRTPTIPCAAMRSVTSPARGRSMWVQYSLSLEAESA